MPNPYRYTRYSFVAGKPDTIHSDTIDQGKLLMEIGSANLAAFYALLNRWNTSSALASNNTNQLLYIYVADDVTLRDIQQNKMVDHV